MDYDNGNSNDPILLQLDTADNAEYYVQFNRKAGANSGTVEGGDQVMITKEESSATRPRSFLMAKLSAGGSYVIENYDGSGRPLTLEVTEIDLSTNPPFASISITTGNPCSTDNDCDDGKFCNGAETCGTNGYCTDGSNPCPSTQSCSEASGGFCGECQSVTLELTTDNYPTETSWQVTDPNSVIIDSGGGYTTQSTAQPVVTIGDDLPCLAEGDHTFTINDSYGDGICCAYGSGSYTLRDQNGAVLHQGGEFGSTESKLITVAVPAPSAPTKAPTKAPTEPNTPAPTKAPTKAPTRAPTRAPTKAPTKAPTNSPTRDAGKVCIENKLSFENNLCRFNSDCCGFVNDANPGCACKLDPLLSMMVCRDENMGVQMCVPQPSNAPSLLPSQHPSDVPSGDPSEHPSDAPSGAPSDVPSGNPSESPSDSPSMGPSTTAERCAAFNSGQWVNGACSVTSDCCGHEQGGCACLRTNTGTFTCQNQSVTDPFGALLPGTCQTDPTR